MIKCSNKEKTSAERPSLSPKETQAKDLPRLPKPSINAKEDITRIMFRDYIDQTGAQSVAPCFGCVLECFRCCPSLFYRLCNLKIKQ